jgi:hypothetical protein
MGAVGAGAGVEVDSGDACTGSSTKSSGRASRARVRAVSRLVTTWLFGARATAARGPAPPAVVSGGSTMRAPALPSEAEAARPLHSAAPSPSVPVATAADEQRSSTAFTFPSAFFLDLTPQPSMLVLASAA